MRAMRSNCAGRRAQADRSADDAVGADADMVQAGNLHHRVVAASVQHDLVHRRANRRWHGRCAGAQLVSQHVPSGSCGYRRIGSPDGAR